MGVRAPGAGGAGGSRAVAPRHGAAAVAAGAPELGYKAEHAPIPASDQQRLLFTGSSAPMVS